MSPVRLTKAVVLAALLVGVAGSACAQQASFILVGGEGGRGDFGFQSASASPVGARRTLEWDARKGRWGLSLDVQQRDGDTRWRDVQPGLYYRVTPRFHIGGAVSLSDSRSESPIQLQPQQPTPRVRLETTFKF
ncbi:MAG: NtrZ family periplasmic regulatory protein [Caulobacteraceae bacterium]